MTTPNIEELIDRLYDWHNTSAEQNRLDMQKAADLLQSQAERIKELEAENGKLSNLWSAMKAKRDTLCTQLSAIAAAEPTYYLGGGRLYGDKTSALFDNAKNAITELFTHPMPAQDVTELVEALEKLARLGNGEHYGNSDGNMIARDALSKYKGAK